MEASSLKAGDLLAVRSRVSWPAIAAGAMIATAIYFVLTLFGVALGIEVAVRGATTHLGAGAAIYSILTLLLAMFFGGWATSRLAVGESKLEAVLYGVILWGTLFLGLVWLFSAGIRTGFGAMVGLSSGAYSLSADAGGTDPSPSPGIVESLRRRYDTELGGEKFVADLKKAGLQRRAGQDGPGRGQGDHRAAARRPGRPPPGGARRRQPPRGPAGRAARWPRGRGRPRGGPSWASSPRWRRSSSGRWSARASCSSPSRSSASAAPSFIPGSESDADREIGGSERGGPMIYFLLNEDERLIEIGMTGHMNTRLAKRRRTHGNALRLLAVIEGDLLEAAAIHERFSDLKVRDDWYRIDTTMVEFIGRQGHPWGGGMLTGTPAYHDRLADLAAISRIPAASLVELALSGWADRNGLSATPAGESESVLARVIDGSKPNPCGHVVEIGR